MGKSLEKIFEGVKMQKEIEEEFMKVYEYILELGKIQGILLKMIKELNKEE